MASCGELLYSQDTRIYAVDFWATNTYEHIEVLLKSASGWCATLYPQFKDILEQLYKDFKKIVYEIENGPNVNHPYLIRDFLEKNKYFITILERLKFEGYNGYPMLYEAVLHFIYEAKYANDVIGEANSINLESQPCVLYQIMLRSIGIGNNPMECSYGQMYFWSLIGAQHPSIIMNITPTESMALPVTTRETFAYYIRKFNDICFELSNIYSKLDKSGLRIIYSVYEDTYVEFLKFLINFKTCDDLLPNPVRKAFPPIFFGVLEHIIDEAEDAIMIGQKIKEYLYLEQ